MSDVRCTYCNDDMKYGEEQKVIACLLTLRLDNARHPLMVENHDRVICYRCQSKMLDWLARASGADIKCYEADIVFERKIVD